MTFEHFGSNLRKTFQYCSLVRVSLKGAFHINEAKKSATSSLTKRTELWEYRFDRKSTNILKKKDFLTKERKDETNMKIMARKKSSK